jgi:membrane associated rhomboid family serine protease
MEPWIDPATLRYVQYFALNAVFALLCPLAVRGRFKRHLMTFWYFMIGIGVTSLMISVMAWWLGQPVTVTVSFAIVGLTVSVVYAMTLLRILRLYHAELKRHLRAEYHREIKGQL